jgi:uncharacterized lipoprotein
MTMDSQKIVIVFVAGLFAIGVLSACNLGSHVTDQANQVDTATSAPNATATTPAPAQPTLTPSTKANVTKPTVTTAPKQPSTATSSKPPTPTVASSVQSSSKKQGDDLDQQLNQLLNDLDNTDTVNDASK